MNRTDHWDDLKSAGDVPPPSAEVLAHARHQLETAAARTSRNRITRRRVMAPAVAAAVIIGGVAVYQATEDPVATPGPRVQHSPGPTTEPSTTPPPPSWGIAGSCVAMYSPAELKKRAFAVDGTVVKVVPAPDEASPTYLLTLQVHEWFKPNAGPRTMIVQSSTPPQGAGYVVSVDFPEYSVGSRLLIAGEPRWGGTDPLRDPVAFGCGFSRVYTPGDAATWRQLLSK